MSASVSGAILGITSSRAVLVDTSATAARSTASLPVACAPVSRSRHSSSSLNASRKPARAASIASCGRPAARHSADSRCAASATSAVTSYTASSVASQAYLAGSR